METKIIFSISRKAINFFASLLIILNYLSLTFLAATPVYAQEVTSSATPSAQPQISPEPSASPISEPIFSPSPVPTPVSKTDNSSTYSPAPNPTPISEWQSGNDNSLTTSNNVEVNHLYVAPQNTHVTVKFTKLPDHPGKLNIKEVTLKDEQVVQTKALSNIAYDISSDMQNGTFEYTLTLPTLKTDNVEVKASEDGQNFVTLGNVTAQADTLTISGLNHFTLFLISADTATSGVFTSINSPAPTITESANGQITTGTIILNAPTGFVFDTGSPLVTVLVTRTGGSGNNNRNINNVASGIALSPTSITTSAITFNVSASSSNGVTNSLTWQNIRVKPAGGTPLVSGNITRSGTSTGGTYNFSTNYDLTETAGAVSASVSTVSASLTSVPADGSTTSMVTVTLKDQFGNPISGKTVSLSSSRGASDTISAASGSSDGSGVVTFTVKSSVVGTSTYTAKDTTDNIDITPSSATVSFTNVAPVANDQSISTNEDTAKAITLSATDVNGDTLTYSKVSGPTHGTLGAVSGNSVTYTPSADYNGADSFTFKAYDGNLDSNTATVSINVSAVNDPPSFDPIANQTIAEDSSLQYLTVTNIAPGPANESGQTVTLSATSSNTSIIRNPNVYMLDPSTLLYTPVANANGTATITVTATDNGTPNMTFSRSFTITVTPVNDPPTITLSSPNGGETWFGGSSHNITWNASDVDAGDSLKVKLEYTTDGGSTYSTIADNLANSGTYSWTVPAIDSTTVKVRATVTDVAFTQGIDSSDANFTIASASISGMKFKDVDGNGSKDNGDSGLSSWTINLSGDSSATATTDSSGNYSFTNLIPGTYQVCEVLKSGWVQTAPASGYDCGNGLFGYQLTLSAGQNVTGEDFGNFNYGQISGKKYEDTNENGEDDSGEPGLSGWTIYIDANNNGRLDSEEISTTTDSSGNYTFSNLGPGTYVVREVLQEGWKQTDPTSTDSSIGGQNDGSYVVTMTSNGNKTQRNFGNFHLGTISGYKFDDTNGDGVWNDDEYGLEDWTIFLDTNDNGRLDEGEISTTTDSDGYFEFSGLNAGTYKVREVPAGWVQTTGNPSDIVVTSGTNTSGVDFGNFQKITITGKKFEDMTANGSYDPNGSNHPDHGLSGWTIFMDDNNNGVLDLSERVATTSAEGSYSFDNLGPGTYKIREASQSGWIQTTNNPTDIVARSGNDVTDINFGNFHKVIITGLKWEDLNANGVKEDTEPVLGGWNIDVSKVTTSSKLSTDGLSTIPTELVQLQLTSQTATGSGQFTATIDRPGTYRLTEQPQSNFQQTFPTDSFFDVFVDFSGQTINTDKNNHPLQFGNAPFQQLSNAKFVPTSGDGSATSSIVVLGDSTISVSSGEGTSSVSLPANTVITKSGGGTIDVSKLSAQAPTIASLTGFDSNMVVDGALQWGIPDLGLEFSQAITLNIFVGTSLNGQTLNVIRSSNGTSGWTSDGIEDPKTCKVTAGICTFKATKASYYATTHTQTSSSSTSTSDGGSSGAGGGGATSPAGAPSCDATKPGSAPNLVSAVAGTNGVTLTWSAANGPTTYYLVTYGLTPGAQTFGNPNVGNVTSYTISGLSGGQTYYFRVRAGNGCAPGDYSNEISATPSGGFVAGPAAGFIPGVLGVKTIEPESGEVRGETTQASPAPQVNAAQIPATPENVGILAFFGNVFLAIAGFFTRLFGGK